MHQKAFVIFSTAYLPPVEFFSYASVSEKIMIEACENFRKQSYRSRCYIYSANGKLPLCIALEHSRRSRLPIKDVRISYALPWNKMHWKAITSAYNKSAYFLYYCDDFEKFYSGTYKWLIELNHDMLCVCLKLLKLNKEIVYSEIFQKKYIDTTDFRNLINPKIKSSIDFPAYTQVFETKYGFIDNLSIIDLLFNCGTESLDYIKKTTLGIQSSDGAY